LIDEALFSDIIFMKKRLQSVPFSKLRHSDLPCYVAEGYGGRPIEKWPVYTFFCQYVQGKKDLAQKNFEEWYTVQLQKYHKVAKKEGGMYKGSLYLLIEKRSGSAFEDANDEILRTAIHERVQQRFALIENIQNLGYNPNSERIDGVKKNGYVYIHGGHHRAAALRALGEDALPAVLVFPNQLVYNLFNLLRNIKYGYFQK
jgi:hypothetical protein